MRKLLDFLNRPATRGNFFARAVNAAPLQILICLLITAVVVAAAVNEYATNKYLNVGYTPDQPVAFDAGGEAQGMLGGGHGHERDSMPMR